MCDYCTKEGGVCPDCGRTDGYYKQRFALVVTVVCTVLFMMAVVVAVTLSNLNQ